MTLPLRPSITAPRLASRFATPPRLSRGVGKSLRHRLVSSCLQDVRERLLVPPPPGHIFVGAASPTPTRCCGCSTAAAPIATGHRDMPPVRADIGTGAPEPRLWPPPHPWEPPEPLFLVSYWRTTHRNSRTTVSAGSRWTMQDIVPLAIGSPDGARLPGCQSFGGHICERRDISTASLARS